MVSEKLIHIFQIQALRLRLEAPKEYCIRQIADDEYNVILPLLPQPLVSIAISDQTGGRLTPIAVTAIGVTCPIIVLNAKEVIAPQETPFSRIAVPKSSAGIDQLSGPLVMKKTKLNSQVSTTNAQ
jgi:hypothetical protein